MIRKDLSLLERAGIQILSRAIKHIGKQPARGFNETLAKQDAVGTMSNCVTAIFHGIEPRRAKKKAATA